MQCTGFGVPNTSFLTGGAGKVRVGGLYHSVIIKPSSTLTTPVVLSLQCQPPRKDT